MRSDLVWYMFIVHMSWCVHFEVGFCGECSAVLESSPGGEASKGCRDGGAAFECALTAGLWKLGDLV